MTTPFFKLTWEEAIAWYKAGKLTVKGLIYASIVTQRRKGAKLVVDSVRKYCQQLDISERAFYKAKASLISDDEICIDIQGKLVIWLNSETVTSTVTEQSCSDSECDTEQSCSDTARSCSDTEQSCSDSLNDRAVPLIYTDLNSDLNSDLSLDRVCEEEKKEEVDFEILEVRAVEVEVEQVESTCADNFNSPCQENNHSHVDNNSSRARDNKSKGVKAMVSKKRMAEIQDAFDNGVSIGIQYDEAEMVVLGSELAVLCDREMREMIQAYRKSGQILHSNPNDIEPEFLCYVGLKNPNINDCHSFIQAYERRTRSWGALYQMVQKWQQEWVAKGESAIADDFIQRGNSKNASAQDKEMADKLQAARVVKLAQQFNSLTSPLKSPERGNVFISDSRPLEQASSRPVGVEPVRKEIDKNTLNPKIRELMEKAEQRSRQQA